jgi:hypothetical protein
MTNLPANVANHCILSTGQLMSTISQLSTVNVSAVSRAPRSTSLTFKPAMFRLHPEQEPAGSIFIATRL